MEKSSVKENIAQNVAMACFLQNIKTALAAENAVTLSSKNSTTQHPTHFLLPFPT